MEELETLWREYCETVKQPTWAISLQLTQYLEYKVQKEEIETVLDLGAGFSSVLFRRLGCETTTVETDEKWLDHAREFSKPRVPQDGRWILREEDRFQLLQLNERFDLVLVDSDDSVRVHDILESPRFSDLVIVDDCHRPKEIQAVRETCRYNLSWEYKTLESTKNGHGRVSALMMRMY